MTEQAPQPTPTPAAPQRQVFPITFLNTKDVLPRRYVVHRHTQVCVACKTVHHWSQAYAFNEMMSRTGAGKPVIHLVPVKKIEYNLPIEVIAIPAQSVAVCHECVGISDFSSLPDPRGTEEWNRIYSVVQAREAAPRVVKKSTTPKTIDDLLF